MRASDVSTRKRRDLFFRTDRGTPLLDLGLAPSDARASRGDRRWGGCSAVPVAASNAGVHRGLWRPAPVLRGQGRPGPKRPRLRYGARVAPPPSSGARVTPAPNTGVHGAGLGTGIDIS